MIDTIANTLARKLSALSFISLSGGIARQTKIKDGSISRTIPAIPDTQNKGQYIMMSPDSSQSGIAYFESQSNQLTDQLAGGRGQLYRAALRVVVWLNLNRITPPDTGAMMAQVVSAITEPIADSDGAIQSVRIVPVGEVPRSPEIFAKWTYNEAETQFLMLPYDYFAFDFTVTYGLKAGCHLQNMAQIEPSC